MAAKNKNFGSQVKLGVSGLLWGVNRSIPFGHQFGQANGLATTTAMNPAKVVTFGFGRHEK